MPAGQASELAGALGLVDTATGAARVLTGMTEIAGTPRFSPDSATLVLDGGDFATFPERDVVFVDVASGSAERVPTPQGSGKVAGAGVDPTGDLRHAEDASVVLHALADLLESKGSTTYANQIRQDADTVWELTSTHPDAQDRDNALLMGKREHQSKMRDGLRFE